MLRLFYLAIRVLCELVEEMERDSLKRNNIVALLNIRHTLTHTLNNTSALMSQDDRESTLWVLAAQRIRIGMADTYTSSPVSPHSQA